MITDNRQLNNQGKYILNLIFEDRTAGGVRPSVVSRHESVLLNDAYSVRDTNKIRARSIDTMILTGSNQNTSPSAT